MAMLERENARVAVKAAPLRRAGATNDEAEERVANNMVGAKIFIICIRYLFFQMDKRVEKTTNSTLIRSKHGRRDQRMLTRVTAPTTSD
jgi:hypothetical protein